MLFEHHAAVSNGRYRTAWISDSAYCEDCESPPAENGAPGFQFRFVGFDVGFLVLPNTRSPFDAERYRVRAVAAAELHLGGFLSLGSLESEAVVSSEPAEFEMTCEGA
jgi:hypothetical protein